MKFATFLSTELYGSEVYITVIFVLQFLGLDTPNFSGRPRLFRNDPGIYGLCSKFLELVPIFTGENNQDSYHFP